MAYYAAVQSQKAVSAYLESKQTLPFVFVWRLGAVYHNEDWWRQELSDRSEKYCLINQLDTVCHLT